MEGAYKWRGVRWDKDKTRFQVFERSEVSDVQIISVFVSDALEQQVVRMGVRLMLDREIK